MLLFFSPTSYESEQVLISSAKIYLFINFKLHSTVSLECMQTENNHLYFFILPRTRRLQLVRINELV